MKMLIYSHNITPRLTFTVQLFFDQLLKCNSEITSDKLMFEAHAGPKLSYTYNSIGDELHLKCADLLFDSSINNQNITSGVCDGIPTIFGVSKGILPFDPLAAGFYMVSRYEEYLPHKTDVHNRFAVTESIAYKNGFLNRPVVNLWAEILRKLIATRFRGFEENPNAYKFVSTIDVDNAYAFKSKGFVRTAGAFARSLINGDLDDVKHRFDCIVGKKHDPYDTFSKFLSIQKKYGFESIYFFLLGDYGVNDKNVPYTSREFQALIKGVADYAKVGIHPSYASNLLREKIKIEIGRLGGIIHRDIRDSRQHFLKFNLPSTYRELIENGIQNEYTMGFSSESGFRAGICSSFNFFDLERNLETTLVVHPFQVMEATLKYYKNITSVKDEAMAQMMPIIQEIKDVKGTYMSLWHSDSISDHKEWAGWADLYEDMCKFAVN